MKNNRIAIELFNLTLAAMALSCSIPTGGVPPVTATQPPVTEPSPATSTPALAVVASPSLVQLAMMDEMNGWAVGETYILRTQDGDLSWNDVTPAGVTGLENASNYFKDADRGWLISPVDYSTGTLYRTKDGGLTWLSQPVPFSGGFAQFLDANQGFLIVGLGVAAGSEYVAIYSTSDGGANWTMVFTHEPGVDKSLPGGGHKSAMAFRDAAHGWIGGDIPMEGYLYLYATQDGGVTWAHQDVPLPDGYTSAMTEVRALHFFDSQGGIMPTAIYMPESMLLSFYFTQDGGATWTPTPPVVNAGLYDFVSAQVGWNFNGSALYRTQDGAQTWQPVSLPPNAGLQDLDFVSPATGWLIALDAAQQSQLYRTIDGGATWTLMTP